MSAVVHRYSRHAWPCCDQVTGPRPPATAKCGGPALCATCAADIGACRSQRTTPAPAPGTPPGHRHTRHGWPCCAQASGPAPVPLAKCGGPLVCQRCGRDAAACPAAPAQPDIDFATLERLHRAEHPNLRHVRLHEDPFGLGEVLHQAIAVHHLLDRLGVPRDDGVHYRGDLDARMWLLAAQHEAMRDQLARIAEQHDKHLDAHGGTDGHCRECGLLWPCPTRVWASHPARAVRPVGRPVQRMTARPGGTAPRGPPPSGAWV